MTINEIRNALGMKMAMLGFRLMEPKMMKVFIDVLDIANQAGEQAEIMQCEQTVTAQVVARPGHVG